MRTAAALLLAAALSLAAPGLAAAQPRSFVIDRFSVTIEVSPDATLTVREALTVEFRGSHQGIYRTIPVRYSRGGFDYALRLDGIRVFDDNVRPLRTEVARADRYVRIKAWVPGAVNATKTVIVTYRVRRGLFDVDDHEELYWNVTGNEWDVPIREAEALVVSPAGVPLDAVHSVAYTGYAGTAGANYAEERADNFITFRTTRPLRPREGLTVAVAWPAGALPKAGRWQEAAWFIGDNWPLGLPALALALALLVWWSFGRDPATNRSIKPEYAPPDGLMPAEAGALVGERAHPSDMSATLVDLAVRGYLKVEQLPGTGGDPDFRFHRLRPIGGDGSIRPFESFLLAQLFGSDGGLATRELSAMRRDYDNVFPPIRDELYRTVVRDGLFPASPARVRAGWIGAGMAALIAAGAVFIWSWDWLGVSPTTLALGLGLSGVVLAAFAPLMPRKTWRGAQTVVRVRGFREFLERAEKDRLARMPGDTLHRWLPWAIALGVVERWIFNFEGLKVDEPTWISGGDSFSLSTYHRAVSGFSRGTEQAIMTGRREAGGGGWSGGSGFSGGSSGGGMGGGGGGTF